MERPGAAPHRGEHPEGWTNSKNLLQMNGHVWEHPIKFLFQFQVQILNLEDYILFSGIRYDWFTRLDMT